AHGGWLTGDGRYFIATDESDAGHLHVFDLTDPAGPRAIAQWENPFDPEASVHNVLIEGDVAYVSWYTSGIFALDVRDPARPQLLAHYDTYPGRGFAFDGVFGIYPYLPSGNILASDMSTGLWIFRHRAADAQLTLTVTDRESGLPLRDAIVRNLAGEAGTTDADGRVTIELAEGSHMLEVEHPGHLARTLDLTVTWRQIVTRRLALPPLPSHLVAQPSVTDGPTTIRFAPSATVESDLRIHDIGGRTLRTLRVSPGAGAVDWDGRDREGRRVPAGMYWIESSAPDLAPGRVQVVR
ncbi:MAG: FlgD immunoglobulin-like domain containing protein, partial [bacterium]